MKNLPTNTKVEPLPTINLVRILKENKFYIWGVEQQNLIDPANFFALQVESSKFANYDGNDDCIHFSNDGDLLRWDKDFTLGITLLLQAQPVDYDYLTLFQNGQNRIILSRGGGNMGIYVSYSQATATNGINTWYEFTYGDKVLFIYDKTSRGLKCYVNGSLKGTIVIPTSWAGIAIPTAGEPNGKFQIGKNTDDIGNYWSVNKYKFIHGGMNNFYCYEW